MQIEETSEDTNDPATLVLRRRGKSLLLVYCKRRFDLFRGTVRPTCWMSLQLKPLRTESLSFCSGHEVADVIEHNAKRVLKCIIVIFQT